jgi:hypothetical protein
MITRRGLPVDFLDRVRRGEITPAKAEELARENGFAPFAAKPPLSIFDPMTATSWTPLQAIVWIATRDINQVREVAEEFRKAWTIWKAVKTDDPDPAAIMSGKLYHGWRLSMINQSTFREAAAGRREIYQARDELWERLIRGDISATGVARRDKDAPHKRVAIPPSDWLDLHFPGDAWVKSQRLIFFDRSLADGCACALQEAAAFDCPDRVQSDYGISSYWGVRIMRGDILALWPAENAGIGTKGKRGRKPLQFDRVANKMRGKSADELKNMKEAEMEAAFGASRDTCRKVRNAILSNK